MTEYQLLVDTWESGGEIDEKIYKANNIAGIIVRLNDMNGGHHMDTGFTKQWEEAKNFLRAPYFVYNPWKKSAENFEWLVAHMPVGAHTVMIDIEVRKPDYSPAAYAVQVDAFMDLVKARWGTWTIYTGEWFLDALTHWPTRCDYWWAQYPYSLYPSSATKMSWDDIREVIAANQYRTPFNANKIPGTYKMWQISGDKIIAPGNPKPIDINVFPGSMDELRAFFGYSANEPPIIVDEPADKPEENNGDDMNDSEAILELAKQVGRIATVFESGGYVPPSGEPPVEPPVDDRIMRTINPRSNGSFPVYRTPDTNEINKIRLVLVGGQQVEEKEPPKKIGNTLVWETTADLHNLMRGWAWLPRQDVIQAANNKMVQIPFFYLGDSDPVWRGCFIERKWLSEKEQ